MAKDVSTTTNILSDASVDLKIIEVRGNISPGLLEIPFCLMQTVCTTLLLLPFLELFVNAVHRPCSGHEGLIEFSLS